MIARKRKGMIVKNTNKKPLSVKLKHREIGLPPGGTAPVTSDEVMEDAMRDLLQVRQLAIVRPLTEQENKEVQSLFADKKKSKGHR